MKKRQVFISYAGQDAFEASLLQYALESMLSKEGVEAWTFQRDQARSEREIAKSLKNRVRDSSASIFLVSPVTLQSGATQWMELAYADAFDVTTFVLLHHLNFSDLRESATGVPPLLLSSQCNSASEWKVVIEDIRKLVKGLKENE
jgi:hypothetical protein